MGTRFLRTTTIRQLLEKNKLSPIIPPHFSSNLNHHQQQQWRTIFNQYSNHSLLFVKGGGGGQKMWKRRYCSGSGGGVVYKNGLVGWYMGLIETRPIFTKSVTSGVIYTVADVTSQMLTPKSSEWSYDWIRTVRMAGYGMIVMGPSLHYWFNFVSRILPKRDVFTTIKKIFLGQTVFGPIMTSLFFSVNASVQGENPAQIVARLKRDLLPTCRNGLMYWPICDFITFKFIPVHLQPLVSNSFSYLWTIYLTYMASLEKASTSCVMVKKVTINSVPAN